MTDEQLLVTVLSIASTLAVGLSVAPGAGAGRLDRGGLARVLGFNAIVLPLVAWSLHGALGLGLAGTGLLVAAAAPGGSTGPLLAVIVAVSFVPAFFVRGRARRLAVAQVSATRNLTLALLVLAALESGPRATIAVLGYGLVMYLATGAVAVVARWRAGTGRASA